jgi:hypothetical protein
MKYSEVVATINSLSADTTLVFAARSTQIAHLLDNVPEGDILNHLDRAGVIPESFGHDSTEEKLYAKYCDALLARSLALIGMKTKVIPERSDAADVSAGLEDYKVVGDAKAFRLSRTAKNQKDLKVEALNSWRKGADYATLCSPLYQYPTAKSQIYHQATTYNVTLLSYTHLAFLIRHKPKKLSDLRSLWTASTAIAPASKNAIAYWLAVDSCIEKITGQTAKAWTDAVKDMERRLPELGREQISFWDAEKKRISQLDKDTAVAELVDALKIESKIETIRENAGI